MAEGSVFLVKKSFWMEQYPWTMDDPRHMEGHWSRMSLLGGEKVRPFNPEKPGVRVHARVRKIALKHLFIVSAKGKKALAAQDDQFYDLRYGSVIDAIRQAYVDGMIDGLARAAKAARACRSTH